MTSQATIEQIRDDLYLILLPTPLPGFDGFIGTWVYTSDPVVVIDVGPAATAPQLLAALTAMGVQRPDLILLTHIHIDHSGGIGTLAKAFPNTPIVCHPKAIPHLIDPERLWQGSLETLGDVARAYGPITPVCAAQVLPAAQLESKKVVCVNTPGHAVHHMSFIIGDLLFAGEAGGVCLPLDDQGLYLRPATPPRFFLHTSLESIDRLLALSPNRICYGHIGMRAQAGHLLSAHRNQLLLWCKLIRPFVEHAGSYGPDALPACLAHLLATDQLLSGFSRLPVDVQQRERHFLLNSIKGFWGYLEAGGGQKSAN